ncbi:MAG: MATE family efflux transporter [Firmicutes bacterium]|nr:MATE family efflux transporter [Bacillota bacterium]
MKTAIDFSKGNIYKLIMMLSYPSIIAMLVNASNNIVNGMYLGNLIGGNALAVTAITLPIEMVFVALGTMATLGTAAMVSVKLGSKRHRVIDNIAFTGIISALILTLGIILFGTVFSDFIISLVGGKGVLLADTKIYYFAILIGWIFAPTIFLANNLLRTVGEAKKASSIMLTSIITNVIFTPIFIVIFDMGIFGAGLANSFGQFLAFLVALYYYKVKKLPFELDFKKVKFKWLYYKKMNLLGFSAFMRQALNSVGAIICNNLFLAYGGVVALNAIGIILKINTFLFLPIFGLLHGLQPLLAYNYGMKNFKRVKEILNKGMLIAFMMSLFAFIMVMIFNNQIINLFTKDDSFVAMAKYGMFFVMVGMPLVGIQLVGSSAFQSFNNPITALFLAVLRQLFLTIPFLLIFSFYFGLKGVWISFPLADCLTGIISYLVIINGLRRIKKRWEKQIA